MCQNVLLHKNTLRLLYNILLKKATFAYAMEYSQTALNVERNHIEFYYPLKNCSVMGVNNKGKVIIAEYNS